MTLGQKPVAVLAHESRAWLVSGIADWQRSHGRGDLCKQVLICSGRGLGPFSPLEPDQPLPLGAGCLGARTGMMAAEFLLGFSFGAAVGPVLARFA